MAVGVKGDEAAKPVTTVGHFQHFLCETAGYFSGHLKTISSLVYGNKKQTDIFNRSQDISTCVCTNQNTRWAKMSPKYVRFNRHALNRSSFLSCFTSHLCLACQNYNELSFLYVLKWPLDAIILRWSDVSSPLHRDLLKKVRNRTNTSKSKVLRTYFVSEPGSVSVAGRQQRQCATL